MNRSGLLGLVRGVRARFVANGIAAVVDVGWNKRGRQTNQGPGGASRVVFMPGAMPDPSAGPQKAMRAGRIDRNAPQNHVTLDPHLRALAWWHEEITVSVWGVDLSTPGSSADEEKQIEATEALLESTMQAIHGAVDPDTGQPAGFASIEDWGESVWTVPPGENAFGREILFGLVLIVPLFDLPELVAYPQAGVTRNPLA
jgi:hypothetical protein